MKVHPGIASLQPYQPGKPVEELARELGLTDIVKLASNENPRGPGEAVNAALVDAAQDLSRYPDGSGYQLKQALAQHLGVNTTQITLGNGSNDVLDLIARLTVEPGTEAIAAEHSFVVYRLAVTSAGGTLVTVPAQNYGADLDAMLAAVNDNTRTIFIANPNNPTGTWVSESRLLAFLQALPERVWVVLDEAYFEYVQDPEYPNGLALLERFPNLIITRTFSKIYGLAALRVGYGVASETFTDLLNRARQPFNVSTLGLAGAQAALGDTAFVADSVALNRDGMAQIEAGLTELGLSFIPSYGNFVTFDCGRLGRDVYDDLLKLGVIVRPIAEYGLPQHLRVSIGLNEENQRFLTALAQVLSEAS